MGLLKILSRRSGKGKTEEDLPPSSSHQRTGSASVNAPASPTSSFTLRAQGSAVSLGGRVSEETKVWRAMPPAPSFRGPLTDDRPGSAHSSRSGDSNRTRTERPKREPRRPPLSFRRPTALAITQLASEQDQMTYQPRKAASDAGSMRSLVKRQSMDLLDAVEEFRTLDFRTRVQAAGARDYGEDVADRNIMAHSTLLTTVSTPDLYSLYSLARSASAQSGWQERPRTSSRTGSENTLDDHTASTLRGVNPSVVAGEAMSFSRRNKMRLSLNTYKPSGLISPGVHIIPQSAVTTPGHRGGMAPGDFRLHNANSPDCEPDTCSRQYRKSPATSNFSIPRSPMARRPPLPEIEKPEPKPEPEPEPEFVDIPVVARSDSRKFAAGGSRVPVLTAGRFSYGTCRSSMASSVTSRVTSMDFQPLGYPKSQGHATDSGEDGELGNGLGFRDRAQSMRSNRPSRSNSIEESYSHPRTRSLLTASSVLKDLAEMKEAMLPAHSGGTRDWALVTLNNGSTASSSSNGLYSGVSGSCGRPTSRHTQATSIDSIPRPHSSQSYLSGSVEQSASGASTAEWSSPGTTVQSTEFNIDDYISSDDDSFIAEKKRPRGEDEGDLLFKDGYGITGAALPGLLESMMDACPPPITSYHRSSRLSVLSQPASSEEDARQRADYAAAVAPDIDDDRPSSSTPRSTQSPASFRRLRPVQSSPDEDLLGTFGRRPRAATGAGSTAVMRPRPKSSKQAPSWLPSDDWARHSAAQQVKRRPLALVTAHKGLHEAGSAEEADASASTGAMQRPCRGQMRLSALGTPHGAVVEGAKGWVESLGANRGEGGVQGSASNNSSMSKRRKEQQVAVPSAPSPIKEEGSDHAPAARLRKEAKARKREEEAKTIREKRTTKAVDLSEEEMMLARVQDLVDQIDRGRARVRDGQGMGVASTR